MQQRKILTSSVLLALFAGFLCEAVDAQSGNRRRSSWRDRVGLKQFDLEPDQKFASKAMGRDAKFSIYLPKSYGKKVNAKKRYPVVYFLHGMREDHNRFHQRSGKVLDNMAAEKMIPELIFVCAHDGSGRSFYINNGRSKVEDLIVEDLVGHVDKSYRTKAESAHRAIAGVSMGGFGAMKIAFKHPDVFSTVATLSAAILPEKSEDLDDMFPWARQSRLAASLFGKPVDEKRWRAENPLALANSIDAAKLRGLNIYFDCGDKDRYGVAPTNALLHKALTKRKIEHSWTLVEGGGHGYRMRQDAVGYPLRFISQAWARAKGKQGLAEILGGKGKKAAVKPGKK